MIGVEMGVLVAPSPGSGGAGRPSSVLLRMGGGAAGALATGAAAGKLGGAGGMLGGGGGGGAAPNADGMGPGPSDEDFLDRRSSNTSRSDPPLSLMMRSFS